MFSRYKIYKHENNTDVAFLVTDYSYEVDDLDGILLRGVWMNITNLGKLHAVANDSITIKYDDVNKWKVYEDTNNE